MRKNIFFLVFLFLPFVFAQNILAAVITGDQVQRDNGVDQGMLYYWLRAGGVVPDSATETLKFRGTGYVTNPANTDQIVNAIALQWIYGIAPAKGVKNYGTSIVEDMKTAGYFEDDQAAYLQSAGTASLFLPTTFEPLPDDQKYKSSAEKGEINKISDLPSIILGGANRGWYDMTLAGMAIARANSLSASVPAQGSMIPEQVGSRDIGKNNNGETPYLATSGSNGNINIPSLVKNEQASALVTMPIQAVVNNPSGGDMAVTAPDSKLPSALGYNQKNVTSIGSPGGNGGALGKDNEVQKSGSPLADLADLLNLAARNSADQINNRINQINNAQNHFSSDPNLNNLQNQFSPNEFDNLLNNRFPSDGNNNNTPTPPVTSNNSNTAVCDPARAALTQQEVVNIADFMGLSLNTSKWTTSYFQAKEFLGTTIRLQGSTSTQVVGSSLVPYPDSCIWVVFAPSANEGVYVTDARNQTGIKFLFSMP